MLNFITRLMYGSGYLYSPEEGLEISDDVDNDEETDDKEENTDDNEDDKDDDKGDEEGEEGEEEESEEEEEDKDDKEDDDKKDDEEEEEESEDEIERTTRASDIKKEFPEIFKKFPDLKGALYRDEQYSELFGSVDDAKTAAERSEALGQIENDLLVKGDPSELLTTLQKQNKDSYEAISFKVLQFAQEKDKDLYFRLASLPIKQLLRSAWKQGEGKTTNLGKAAAVIHQFFFENVNFDEKTDGEGRATSKTGKTKEQEAYEERLREIDNRELTNFENSVQQSYVRKMDSEIRASLEKDDRLTPYMRDKLIEDVLLDIKRQLSGDPRYTNQMGSLWKQAKTAKFSNDFKSRIINAALARAKSLVPETRKKLLARALGKGTSNKKKDTDSKDNREKKVQRPADRDTKKNQPDKPKSDLDILRS